MAIHFWQPYMSFEAEAQDDQGRKVTLKGDGECREAIACTLKDDLSDYLGREVQDPVRSWKYSFVTEKNLRFGLRAPGKVVLGIGSEALFECWNAPYTYDDYDDEEGEDQYRRNREERDKKVISQRVVDFYYLADLFCGTFGVLWSPYRRAGQKKYLSRVPRRVGSLDSSDYLDYHGVDNTLLLHPALPSFFLGLLRLAAFLALEGQEVKKIRALVRVADLRRALERADRKACTRLLRQVKRYIVRRETGLWTFGRQDGEKFNRLLNYLASGGTALTLFSQDVAKNWQLDVPCKTPPGFRDFSKPKGALPPPLRKAA